MREHVYRATREAHEKVEGQFGFAQGLKAPAYFHFLLTMYRTRLVYQPSFDALERLSGLSTCNFELLGALKEDLRPFYTDLSPGTIRGLSGFMAPTTDLSRLTGIHYVFAGSAAGARIVLKMIKVSKMDLPNAYIQRLDRLSGGLMAELENAMKEETLNPSIVIEGASEAFEWFYQISLDAEIQRNTVFEGTGSPGTRGV